MGKTKKRYGVDEASRQLGITKEALRKRIHRGSIEAVKDSQGRWEVILDENTQDKGADTGKDGGRTDRDELVQHLREEVDFLRQELYRKDTIIMSLSDGIKQLEAPRKRTWKERIFGAEDQDGE